jgi:DNA-binding response OmpR family regulator
MAKILMVDDDRDFLEACKTILEHSGHNVCLASNVKEAHQQISSENPDLIFLDIMMDLPDDGISLLHKLKSEGLEAPIIMLSAVGKVTGYDYGECSDVMPCDGFLAKPVNPQDLINRVEIVLGR